MYTLNHQWGLPLLTVHTLLHRHWLFCPDCWIKWNMQECYHSFIPRPLPNGLGVRLQYIANPRSLNHSMSSTSLQSGGSGLGMRLFSTSLLAPQAIHTRTKTAEEYYVNTKTNLSSSLVEGKPCLLIPTPIQEQNSHFLLLVPSCTKH